MANKNLCIISITAALGSAICRAVGGFGSWRSGCCGAVPLLDASGALADATGGTRGGLSATATLGFVGSGEDFVERAVEVVRHCDENVWW